MNNQHLVLLILKEARGKLQYPANWLQGMERNGEGGYCAYGAVRSVTMRLSGPPKTADLVREATQALIDSNNFPGGSLVEWNDHPHRTHAQIVCGFDRAIGKLERQLGVLA